MSSNRLRLNPEKSQFIWLGTWQRLRRFSADPFTKLFGVIITPTISVRDLGCILGSKLTVGDHVNSIVSGYMFQFTSLLCVTISD